MGSLEEQSSHLSSPSCMILYHHASPFGAYCSLSHAGLLTHSLHHDVSATPSEYGKLSRLWWHLFFFIFVYMVAFVKFPQVLGSVNFIFCNEHLQLFPSETNLPGATQKSELFFQGNTAVRVQGAASSRGQVHLLCPPQLRIVFLVCVLSICHKKKKKGEP